MWELNNRREVGQLAIGIEDGFMMEYKNQWIKGYLNVTEMLWSLGIKAILV
jgi:hypothetical protein